MQQPRSSEYFEREYRTFSLYTLTDRAIPSLSDGLKPSGRRVVYVMSLNNTKAKTATVAGAAMRYHPHDSPDDAANTLAARFGNNIPILQGHGAFGTLLEPKNYGASRYTSIELSEFTKDAVLVDYDIIPMVPNYDDTTTEPAHFLPLVPIVVLNPSQGIAVGFASRIAPRSLRDIITSQLLFLAGKPVADVMPCFTPTESHATSRRDGKGKNSKWMFEGEYDVLNASSIRVTKLPFGLPHSDFVNHLNSLVESYAIIDYEDRSRDVIDITIHMGRGNVKSSTPEKIKTLIGLTKQFPENLNVLDLDGDTVRNMDYVSVITEFTAWRLTWYVKRYERLLDLIRLDIQRYKDVILAIDKNVGSIARKIQTRDELIEFLIAIGVVNTDYIAQLPVYRFTQDERAKTQEKLDAAVEQERSYLELLGSEDKRKQVYVSELKAILKKHG